MELRYAKLTALSVPFLFVPLAVFAAVPLGAPEVAPACGFDAAVLCGELPANGRAFAAILDAAPNEHRTWRLHLWTDLPFLVGYSLALVAAALAFRGNHPRIARLAVVSTVLAGAMDLSENVGILSALSSLEAQRVIGDGHAAWTRWSAYAKFTAIGVAVPAVAYLVASTEARARWLRGMLGVAGALGASAVFCTLEPRVIEPAMLAITIMLVIILALAGRTLFDARRGARTAHPPRG